MTRMVAMAHIDAKSVGAGAVQRELLACYELIESIGRGVVYYGSARLKADNPHFVRSRELGKMVSQLLGTPTWTGGGPGMMEAASLGAMDAGKPVAGIRIEREAGTKVRSAAQSYLKPEHAVFCKFLSPRKVALVDAGVARVVVGFIDPDPRVSGGGIQTLLDAGIEVAVGCEEALCREINADFIERQLALRNAQK